jgi:hypothetical protein
LIHRILVLLSCQNGKGQTVQNFSVITGIAENEIKKDICDYKFFFSAYKEYSKKNKNFKKEIINIKTDPFWRIFKAKFEYPIGGEKLIPKKVLGITYDEKYNVISDFMRLSLYGTQHAFNREDRILKVDLQSSVPVEHGHHVPVIILDGAGFGFRTCVNGPPRGSSRVPHLLPVHRCGGLVSGKIRGNNLGIMALDIADGPHHVRPTGKADIALAVGPYAVRHAPVDVFNGDDRPFFVHVEVVLYPCSIGRQGKKQEAAEARRYSSFSHNVRLNGRKKRGGLLPRSPGSRVKRILVRRDIAYCRSIAEIIPPGLAGHVVPVIDAQILGGKRRAAAKQNDKDNSF